MMEVEAVSSGHQSIGLCLTFFRRCCGGGNLCPPELRYSEEYWRVVSVSSIQDNESRREIRFCEALIVVCLKDSLNF